MVKKLIRRISRRIKKVVKKVSKRVKRVKKAKPTLVISARVTKRKVTKKPTPRKISNVKRLGEFSVRVKSAPASLLRRRPRIGGGGGRSITSAINIEEPPTFSVAPEPAFQQSITPEPRVRARTIGRRSGRFRSQTVGERRGLREGRSITSFGRFGGRPRDFS